MDYAPGCFLLFNLAVLINLLLELNSARIEDVGN
jgi:hypothetical protein